MPALKRGWKPIFLAELARWGIVVQACKAAGIHRDTAYQHRATDPKFAKAWDEAEQQVIALMEQLAIQRATVGQKIPVIYQGKVMDHIQEVDNGLLKWLLSKKKPEVYGDHTEKPQPIDVNMHVEGSLDLKALSVEQLRTLRDILTAATIPEADRHGISREEPLRVCESGVESG